MTSETILRGLSTKSFGRTLHFFNSIDSTNTAARKIAGEGAPEGSVVVALEQKAGRGRQNRSWISEPGKDLTFSVVLRPPIRPESLGIVSLYASVAVATMLSDAAGIAAGCKWPNDVMAGGKKISGILSESVISGATVDAVVVGIGLNVNQEHFPGGIASTSTSMKIETGREADLSATLCALLGALESLYRPAAPDWPSSVISAWTERNVILGARVEILEQSGRISGIATSVSATGALRVETDGGPVEVSAGDVHLA